VEKHPKGPKPSTLTLFQYGVTEMSPQNKHSFNMTPQNKHSST